MVDAALLPALRAALRTNEIGNASPYKLSYARLGASGASFGIFQADTNVNASARTALTQALAAAGISAADATRIVDRLHHPCPHGSPLGPADQQTVDAALASPTGRPIVDAMDQQTLDIILGELDTSIAAAAAKHMTIEPQAQIAIALWVNMTGAPRTLNAWLGGTSVSGVAPPAGPVVRRADIMHYLTATKFFQLHPKNLVHFNASVDAGVPLPH